MTILTFTLFVFAGSVFAGFLGSMTGLGGGVVIIPLLTYSGIDLQYAIGTAIIAVIATSSGSAAAYVKERLSNIRIGIFLEIATTLGAVAGAFLALGISPASISILLGLVIIYSSVNSLVKKTENTLTESTPLAKKLKLEGSYPVKTDKGIVEQKYGATHTAGGFSIMAFAGMISAMLGIGAGALKVLAMDQVMRLPFKVSTTTSNFMIGVTATAGACVYLQKGYIHPQLCMPVIIGVLTGSSIGARMLINANVKKLRVFFAVIIFIIALSMIYKGVTGQI